MNRRQALLAKTPARARQRLRCQLMTPQDLDDCCKRLLGSSLTSAEKREYTWFVSFGADVMIDTQVLWRLIDDGRLVVTSEDDGHPFGRAQPVDASSELMSSVRARTVTAAAIDPSSGDLRIDFGERVQLQFLQTSCGYEAWRLTVRGREIICGGGGEIMDIPVR